MIETKENKAGEGQVADLDVQIDTVTYHEKTYPVREVSDSKESYAISTLELEAELLDGMRNSDPFAFELDESIYFYCTKEQIRTLSDEEILEMVD
ncbi:hypothetical protein [Phocaeicola sp.]